MVVDYKALANYLLDSFIDTYSLKGSVEFLMGYGYDKEELLELGFELENNESVMQDLEESE